MSSKFKVPDYGMYTKRGNAVIHGVVMSSMVAKLEWKKVVDILRELSKTEGLGESMDTAVREIVYINLENFYANQQY